MEAAYFLRGQGTLRATFLVGNEPLLIKPHPNYWTGLWDAGSGAEALLSAGRRLICAHHVEDGRSVLKTTTKQAQDGF